VSRYYDWFESVTPEEYPETYTERGSDAERAQKPWKRDDVYAYREALVRMGLGSDAIEDLIKRDCGAEFCERPMLGVRQAS
jgi:hypothetical protein